MGQKGLFTLVSLASLWSPFHKKSVQSRMRFKGKGNYLIYQFLSTYRANKLQKHQNMKNKFLWKKNKNSPIRHLWQALCVRQIYTAKEGPIYFPYCTFVFYLIFRLRTRKKVKKECTERIRMCTVKDRRGKGVWDTDRREKDNNNKQQQNY